jgi:hypothetical protein
MIFTAFIASERRQVLTRPSSLGELCYVIMFNYNFILACLLCVLTLLFIFSSAFSETVKERLQDGGASGAFFFFSKGERFLAKSCTLAEMLNIRRNSETYASYFEKHPRSCIARVTIIMIITLF